MWFWGSEEDIWLHTFRLCLSEQGEKTALHLLFCWSLFGTVDRTDLNLQFCKVRQHKILESHRLALKSAREVPKSHRMALKSPRGVPKSHVLRKMETRSSIGRKGPRTRLLQTILRHGSLSKVAKFSRFLRMRFTTENFDRSYGRHREV